MASLFSRVGSAVQRTFSPVPASSVSSWLYGAQNGLAPHEPFAGAWQRNLDQARSAGPNVMAFSAIYACINIISSDLARMPLRVMRQDYKGDKQAGRSEFRNHPAWTSVRNPNPQQTSLQFLQQYFVSKLTHGNAYVVLFRDGRNVINEMYVLDPRSVQPLIDSEGNIFYQLGREPLANIPNPVVIPARDMIHDRCQCLFHPLVGVSPLFAAAMSAMQGSRIQMNSDTFFANMSRSSGVLTAPGKIDPKLAKVMQTEWDQNYSGRGLGKVAVLSNGLKYESMTISAVDAELVNQLRWVVEDIARSYRVPGFKLGDLNKTTYRNSEQMSSDYMQNCLSYHIEGLEQCFNRAFALSEDISIEFDLRPLFRMETDIRYAAHQTALTSGWKSINEVRSEEDMPPVKGGEEPRVQAQYIPLSKADGVGVTIPGTPDSSTPAPAASPAPAPAPAAGKDLSTIDLKRLVESFSTQLQLEYEAN